MGEESMEEGRGSSVVEPAPQREQVLRGCGFESH